MRELIIKRSLRLKNNHKYQEKKKFFKELVENRETSYTKYFDSFMVVLILFSVSILVLNKTVIIPNWLLFIDIYIISFIFFLEYFIRFWIFSEVHLLILEQDKKGSSLWLIIKEIIKQKRYYIFSITGIIDFLAIFPQFRIIRLLKLFHYLYGTKTLIDALSAKEFEFKFLGYILVTVLFSFASILYVVEYGINKNINSFLDALYWALVTISTVGYGDISPVTDVGKVISMVGIIFGIAMISFVTSVMVSAFAERFDELRINSSINSLHHLKNIIVLNGYGYLGSRIAHYIEKGDRYNCVVIEEERDENEKTIDSSHLTIYGDGCSTEIMEKLYKQNNIIAMLTLKSSDIDNIHFILNAKSYNKDGVVFSRISYAHLISQYSAIGTDRVIDPYAIIHKRAFHYVKNYINKYNQEVILFGYGQKSKNLAHMFKDANIEIKIYERNQEQYQLAQESDFEVEMINFEDEKHLETIKSLNNNLIICSLNDEAINHYLAISLKINEFHGKIVALTDTKQTNRQLKLAGVDVVFDLYDESAKEFIDLLDQI